MNQKVLETLEYNKIIKRLTELAATPTGKETCRTLLPSGSYEEVELSQSQTQDALSRIYKQGNLSFHGIRDIRPSLAALDIGSSLGIAELLNIASLLESTLRIKTYGRNEKSEAEKEHFLKDALTEDFEALIPLSILCREINRCIISEEEIADDASAGLKNIRRSIKVANDKIHEQLGALMNSQNTRQMLQDALITMRNNRYCLPVKAEYKSSFPGMVHDQSATGSTLFIEPVSVVKLNNDLKELQLKEQEEIEKILATLSASCAEVLEELKINYTTLCHLDFVFAKAMLAKEMNASRPDYNKNGYINIKKGRHPLIPSKQVVPIDIYLGKDFNLLVVTGPNTGGKTVSLKTVGLFTLMGQAGLHIPAFDHSELSIFTEVYADIGDEQSIEQSLSTFSSHMTNTVSILEHADEHSLCLFDELGAGTDPTEGAALAMAILSDLLNRGAKTVATTHYSELKLFALSTPEVENACCEFDVATLRPTYRLLIGIPGKSNAFAISKKLGLPDHIIDDARERINAEDKTFEDVISDLEESRVTMEKEQQQLEAYKAEIEALKKKLKEKNERIDKSKEKILNRANEEAREILEKAKEYADETIKKYNKWSNDSGLNRQMEQERTRLREKLSENEKRMAKKEKKVPVKKVKASQLHIGDSIRVVSLGLTGTVSSLPDQKGKLYVQTGILKSQVDINDIELVAEDSITLNGSQIARKKSSSSTYQSMKMSKSEHIHSELNLIGKTVDEAVSILDKYLDDAYLAHIGQVTIIHGFGTGALRTAVHNHLKKTSYVKSYQLEETNHGSTVAVFKS